MQVFNILKSMLKEGCEKNLGYTTKQEGALAGWGWLGLAGYLGRRRLPGIVSGLLPRWNDLSMTAVGVRTHALADWRLQNKTLALRIGREAGGCVGRLRGAGSPFDATVIPRLCLGLWSGLKRSCRSPLA